MALHFDLSCDDDLDDWYSDEVYDKLIAESCCLDTEERARQAESELMRKANDAMQKAADVLNRPFDHEFEQAREEAVSSGNFDDELMRNAFAVMRDAADLINMPRDRYFGNETSSVDVQDQELQEFEQEREEDVTSENFDDMELAFAKHTEMQSQRFRWADVFDSVERKVYALPPLEPKPQEKVVRKRYENKAGMLFVNAEVNKVSRQTLTPREDAEMQESKICSKFVNPNNATFEERGASDEKPVTKREAKERERRTPVTEKNRRLMERKLKIREVKEREKLDSWHD